MKKPTRVALSKQQKIKSRKLKTGSIKQAGPLGGGGGPQAWLGHQETLYSGLLWHLDVPHHNTQSQFDPINGMIVFPGRAAVNITTPGLASNLAQVNIQGHTGAWVTDIQYATNKRPRLYGFDFGRVTEAWDDAANVIKLMPELPVTQRNNANIEFSIGERTMMRDLISSTLFEGGEVIISYHMFNPFFGQVMSRIPGYEIWKYLTFESTLIQNSTPQNSSVNFVGGLDTHDVTTNQRSRDYMFARFNHLGDMLDDILSDTQVPNTCNIYLRLFHEANLEFFWWGRPKGSSSLSQTYIDNFHKLWCFAVNTIESRMTGLTQTEKDLKKDRLKFVFSANAESSAADLDAALDGFIPSNPTTTKEIEFVSSIDVLGLDYYQDDGLVHPISTLNNQYQEIVDKATLMGVEHAITEVGIRTKFAGKLYGAYTPRDETTSYDPWNGQTRNFFQTIANVTSSHEPKWVMFWANRFGNSVVSNYTPTVVGAAGNDSGLYYGYGDPSGKCINLFNDHAAEIYVPTSPNFLFSITTYQANMANPTGLTIHGGIDSDRYITGAVLCPPGDCTADPTLGYTTHGLDYLDAVNDFNLMFTIYSFDTM